MTTKPLTHIVFFNQKNSFDTAEAARLIGIMKTSIPGLLTIQFGPRDPSPIKGYVDRSQGFTHALVSTHADAGALYTYTHHSTHLELVKYIREHAVHPPCCIDMFSKL